MLRWVVIHKPSANVLPTSSTRSPGLADALKSCADHSSLLQERFTTLTATELREKLLREKVKALRKSSSTQKDIDADEG